MSLTEGVDGQVNGAARMSTMSGEAVGQYQAFADRSAYGLVKAALTDCTLGRHLDAAAAATAQGAAQIDAISAQAQQTYAAAAVARTPAAQRTVLAALQSHLTLTKQVVDSTKRQAAGLAAGVRALDYRADAGSNGPGTVRPVDFVTGGPLPQEPPPPVPSPPPVTGPPIKYNPPPTPPMVIDASPHDDPGGGSNSGAGFPKCDTILQLKYFGEILAGGTLFGASIPVDLATLGLGGTAGLIGGGWMVGDGADNLRRCK